MTEKEKMLAGLPYNADDPTLVSEQKLAKSKCHQFNLHDPTQLDERMEILRSIINFKGSAHIEPNFYCDYGYNIELGDNFYSNHNLTILDVCSVIIGENVFIAPHVVITTATHPLDAEERRETEYGEKIKIGNDVWIGSNVSILAGVTIGNNCVIGAGSVVNKDIPDNSLAVGVPCQVKKSI